jgi:hypothetical protein
MKLFNCQVRLAGNMLHSVPRYGISEREIRMLRSMHGDDAVVEVKEVGESDRSERDILNELAARYGRTRVEGLFGVSLDNFQEWLDSQLNDELGPVKTEAPGLAPIPLPGTEENVAAARKTRRQEATEAFE